MQVGIPPHKKTQQLKYTKMCLTDVILVSCL